MKTTPTHKQQQAQVCPTSSQLVVSSISQWPGLGLSLSRLMSRKTD